MSNRTKYYHADEVAEILDCSVKDVYAMLGNGELKGHKIKRKWLIDKEQEALNVDNANKQERKQPTYSTTFIKDVELDGILYKEMLSAKDSIRIATANVKGLRIKGEPFLKFFNKLAMKGVRIELLCSKPYDYVLEDINDKKKYGALTTGEFFELQVCRRNHMKVFVFDKKKAYIGSANMTQAAMGRQNAEKRNFEAGVFTNDPDIVRKVNNYFLDIWTDDYCETCQMECEKNQ